MLILATIDSFGDYRAALGEGPLWDHRSQQLVYVDLLKGRLIALNGAGELVRQIDFGQGITSIGLANNGGYIATSERRFMLLDAAFVPVWESSEIEPEHPGNRFNDGKTCPIGRYWAGTMHRDLLGRQGMLYCLDGTSHRIIDRDYRVSNGPAFSRDGSCLYHTDTLDRVIYRFAMDANGSISNRAVFAEFSEGDGGPDGMTLDSEGRLYVAHFGGSKISRFQPNGTVDGIICMPAVNITSLTFGGPGFATLFATSANCTFEPAALESRPLEGATFAIDCGARGYAQPFFKCEANLP